MRKKYTGGFTLIELLVTMALVGVLSGMVIFVINPLTQIQKARDSQRKSDLKLVQSNLEFYMSDIDYYPAPISPVAPSSYPTCGSSFTDPTGTRAKYLDKIPCDPKNGSTYTYLPTGKDGVTVCNNTTIMCSKYRLVACLEYSGDPDKDSTKYASCSTASYSVYSP